MAERLPSKPQLQMSAGSKPNVDHIGLRSPTRVASAVRSPCPEKMWQLVLPEHHHCTLSL